MENLVFTQLSIPEVRQLFRQEIESYFESQKQHNLDQSEADVLLTIQQSAEILSLSVPTIYGLVSRSEIPCMKKGKRLYFSKHELTEWIKSGRKKTLAEIANETDKFLSNKKRLHNGK